MTVVTVIGKAVALRRLPLLLCEKALHKSALLRCS
jgi:hypothetical protein